MAGKGSNNKQYMFFAGGDSPCDACAGLDGTMSNSPQAPLHANCQCQDVPTNDNSDCPTVTIDHVQVLTQGRDSTVIGGEMTVTCCDGTEISESVSQDLGPASPADIQKTIMDFEDAASDADAAAMAEGCPEGIDVWVEDGEEEGLA